MLQEGILALTKILFSVIATDSVSPKAVVPLSAKEMNIHRTVLLIE